jgi:plasmid stability protein
MTTPDRTILNIRNFPADLYRKLKVRAAEEGKTLKDLCIELLDSGLKTKGGNDNG